MLGVLISAGARLVSKNSCPFYLFKIIDSWGVYYSLVGQTATCSRAHFIAKPML
jgi:hypothetical protein